MHPAQLERLQKNTQYHRDMASYYAGEARRMSRTAKSGETREGEPAEGEEMAPKAVPEAAPDAYEVESMGQLAEMHAEAAKQLEEIVANALKPSAKQKLDEIQQVMPKRAGGLFVDPPPAQPRTPRPAVLRAMPVRS